MKTPIIATTLSTAGSDRITRLEKVFDIVIIDEACQSTELGLLVALRHETTRVVLVGDPCQLPATIFSEAAIKCG